MCNLFRLFSWWNKVIVNDSIESIKKVLVDTNIVDEQRRKNHVKDIKTKVKDEKEMSDNMICPKCGSQLVNRNGKYGFFIGCSNYPKCRYIKK